MKKSLFAAAMIGFAVLTSAAQAAEAVAKAGKMLVAADGARVGSVYRVTDDGSAQLILDGKLVTIPADTLSLSDGKLKTSMQKSEIRKLK